MSMRLNIVKEPGDTSIAIGDRISLTVVRTFPELEDSPLIFQTPLHQEIIMQRELLLTLGDTYHADVIDVEDTRCPLIVDGVDYSIVEITVANFMIGAYSEDIVLRGEHLIKQVILENAVYEEMIPVTVRGQMYRYDYVPGGIVNIKEVYVGEFLFCQILASDEAVKGTMTDSLKKFLPEISFHAYLELGTLGYDDWETIKQLYKFPVRQGKKYQIDSGVC